jgi:hypothetical protein
MNTLQFSLYADTRARDPPNGSGGGRKARRARRRKRSSRLAGYGPTASKATVIPMSLGWSYGYTSAQR